MAQKIVKCFYCGDSFDANAEPFAKPRVNRYAHLACHEKAEAHKTQEERDYDQLVRYINDIFNINEPYPKILRQIKEYKEKYNYTYTGIYKTLVWWREVKGKPFDNVNYGIAIVPYIYQEATEYYYAIWLAAQKNAEVDVACITRVREFIIDPPSIQRRPPRLIDLDYLDKEENDDDN